jgi:CTP:molybdopterin cytidylyltransferase MocA
VLERVRASSVEEIVVVLGAHDVPTSERTVRCPEWSRGAGASLRCGLAVLGPDIAAAVVVLADGPDLDPAAIERVIAAWREHGDDVVAATYTGQRLHPVLLARAAWRDIPDEGARDLPARLVACDDLHLPGDVDYREQLPARLRGES